MIELKKMTWPELALLFGIPTVLNFIAFRFAMPQLAGLQIFPIEVTYFLCVGGLVLAPMFVSAIYLSGRQIGSFRVRDLLVRMRIFRLTGRDWLWTVATFVFLCATSFVIAKIWMPMLGMDARPIFFFFNIFGEEFLWRGYIQPRQEQLTGKWTWLVHGLLWAMWHLPMGLDLILASAPIFFILPAVVQIRKNTSIAIIVHAVFGTFGFLALALGALH